MAIPVIHLSLDLEIVLSHQLPLDSPQSLHQEIDKRKDLNPQKDLVVVSILKLASMRWLSPLHATLQIQDTRVLKDPLKRPLAQQHDLSMIRRYS